MLGMWRWPGLVHLLLPQQPDAVLTVTPPPLPLSCLLLCCPVPMPYLSGHTLRVLYLAVSPDGQTIVTGAGDETLRFWNVFPSAQSQGHDNSVANMTRTLIR